MIDASRLFTTLLKTTLRSKDPVLYQLLYDLIGNAVDTNKAITGITNGSGGSGSTTTIINNSFPQINLGITSERHDFGFLGIPTPAPIPVFPNVPPIFFDTNDDYHHGIIGSPNDNAVISTSAITGSGSSGQVTFWTGSSSLSGDNGLFWDNTNKALGIGTTSPSVTFGATLEVHTTTNANLGIRTLAGIAGSGIGVAIDSLNDAAGAAAKMGFRASEYQILGGNVGIGITNPGTYGGILTAHAATNCNLAVRTISGIGGSGTGPALDSLLDNASGVTSLGFRASDYQFLTGSITIFNDILWGNDTGFGLVSFVGGHRFLSYTSAGGTILGSGGANTTLSSTGDINFQPNSTQAMRLFASGGLSLGNTTDPGLGNVSITGTGGTRASVTVNQGAFGAGSAGAQLFSGNNISGAGAPGSFAFTDRSSSLHFVFSDTLGVLRIVGTSPPAENGGACDLTGTIIGFQTEKNNLSIPYDGTNNNDQNPGTGNVLRVTNNGTNTGTGRITGLSGGVAGRVVLIINDDTQLLTLPLENVNSTAANRFYDPSGVTAAPLIPRGGGQFVYYSGDASRWIVIY